MRKFFSFVMMMLLVVSFSSCSKVENDAKEASNEGVPVQKESTVSRVFYSSTSTGALYSVLLEDKTILYKGIVFTRDDRPSEFFFLQKGDTVVYSGDEVIEIHFNGE